MKKKLKNLRIKEVKHLAMHLGTNTSELNNICHTIDTSPRKYYFQWHKTFKNGKIRPMVKIHGRLRVILDRLKKLFQRIDLPPYVHGGVPGRSTKTNAKPHLNKPMLVCADLEKHFPNTSHRKVYSMFCQQQECSPNIARILTRLTTLNGALPQGSPTSTIISNLVTLPLTKRLYGFAEARGAKCTQYVDDYTFSGNKRLARCQNKIAKIIKQGGHKINLSKTKVMPATEEQITTGIKVNNPSPDIPKEKLRKARQDMNKLEQMIENYEFISEKKLKSIQGQICYIRQFNPGAAKFQQNRLNRIKRKLV